MRLSTALMHNMHMDVKEKNLTSEVPESDPVKFNVTVTAIIIINGKLQGVPNVT